MMPMNTRTHQQGDCRVAEVSANHLLIRNAEDGLQILVDLYYQDFDKIILFEENITPIFFDLKTGVAGEILQKFSNFRMQLIIIGDFNKYPGKSFRDFIFECNKGSLINFLSSVDEAKERLFR